MPLTKILIVDDDVELAALLRDYLAPEGFEIELVHDGRSGLERAKAGQHGAVVLDIMLPGMGGLDVLRALRAVSRVPVLMLTARGEEIDRIVGLELGADDYLPKPFNARELLARLRAILRRAERPAQESQEREVLSGGDVTLDVRARKVERGGRALEFTSVEFALLEMLMRSIGKTVNREAIYEAVLGRRFSAFDRSIDVHVSSIRKKLGPTSSGRERIKTVRGVGYVYVEDV